MKRRQLLVLLGLGGVTGGGYVFATDRERPSRQLSRLDTPSPEQSLEAIDRRTVQTRVSAEPFPFLSAPVTESVADDSLIRQVIARPAPHQTGDRVRLNVSTASDPEDLADRIRVALNVQAETTVQTTIDEREVTFQGGATGHRGVLVGVVRQPSPAVLIARGDSVNATKTLVTEWELD